MDARRTGGHSRAMHVFWNASLLAALVATIGLLATALFRQDGKIDGLGAKIDGLGARLDTRIGQLDAKVDAMGASLNGRIDALAARMDVRFDRVEARLEHHLRTPH